jgi:hypothetical protein
VYGFCALDGRVLSLAPTERGLFRTPVLIGLKCVVCRGSDSAQPRSSSESTRFSSIEQYCWAAASLYAAVIVGLPL